MTMDFLVEMRTKVPDEISEKRKAELTEREGARISELALDGYLHRLWRITADGEPLTVGLWEAETEQTLSAQLDTLPLREWMKVKVIRLTPHRFDPR